jgi:ribonucleoside-diphosphate reductase alpha chain
MGEGLILTQNAIKVLERRYLQKDDDGICIETPEMMFRRVSDAVASAELEYGASNRKVKILSDKFYDLFIHRYFMPNSPTLMNAGAKLGQLAACFALPIDDSLESIFQTLKNTALIHQSGGGTGFSFSRLRPKNSVVHSTKGVSSGPISFMEVFNAATEAVKQGGTRRGANMGVLRVDHPDIEEFISCKNHNDKLNNFNISVAITDKFMEACFADKEYELINPQNGEVVGKKFAPEIMEKILQSAWQNGEPGLLFIDRINQANPTPKLGEIETTNPCGEVPLLPYEACNLGSINLGLMVNDNDGEIDWGLLENTVRLATRFLDNVITVNKYPLPEIERMVKVNRKIGLGVMGFADLLMKMGVSYASKEGVAVASEVMEFIDYVSKAESINLAKERGKFSSFDESVYNTENYFYKKYSWGSNGKIQDKMWKSLDLKMKKYGIRNATTTCIAPTGTISMIAGASGSIEPLFGLVFVRNIMDGTELLEINSIFEKYLKSSNLYSKELMFKISKSGSVRFIDEIPQHIKDIFITAHDISPYWHVKIQAAFQAHTDNAVSKTVNFEENATIDDIRHAYILAYRNNLKGVTVYRDNSRSFQPMNIKTEPKTEQYKIKIKNLKDVCPECGAELKRVEGCVACPNCGYSGCS